MFISQNTPEISKNNDLNLPINKVVYDQLIEAGVDPILSTHLSHLFIRDPLVIYDNRIDIDPNENSDHFEVFFYYLKKEVFEIYKIIIINRIFNQQIGKR